MSLEAITIPAQSDQSPKQLVVILHGWGANAQDVAFLCGLLDLPQTQFMLPDAPFTHPYDPRGRMWYDLPATATFQTDFNKQADLNASREKLITWLRSLPQKTGIPLEQTILGGFSQGGAMTLDVGLRLPLAGLMVLSGYQHCNFVAPNPVMPVLMVHGRQDMVVPLQAAHQAKQAIEKLAVPLTYQEFEMGHEISPEVLQQMQQFIQTVWPGG